MIESLIQLLASVTVSTALAAFLLWLTRTWLSERLKASIKNEYDQRLESHKSSLKAQADVELEKLRSQLIIATTEHEIRFSRLHEKRAEIIAKTYSLLRELFDRLGRYVQLFEQAGGPSRDDRRNAAIDAHKDFRGYYTAQIIFFPKDVAAKLEKIDSECINVFNEFAISVEIFPDQDRTKKWVEIFERVRSEIRAALSELEDEFRRLLGDKT